MRDTVELTSQSGEHPRLNRRQAAKVRTRQKVLEAARALFSERGYDAATIRDIAKGADMSTGAVFASFQDKAELFEAVMADEFDVLIAEFNRAAATQRPVRERLAEVLTAGYHRALDSLPMMQAIIARSWFQPVADDKRQRVLRQPHMNVITSVLQDGIRSGELSQDVDLTLLSRMIWDVYVANYRLAAYDGWGMEELTPHIRKQIDLILSSQLA